MPIVFYAKALSIAINIYYSRRMKDIDWTKEFPERLERRMRELDINATQLSEMCGLSFQLTSKWRKGERCPSTKTLLILERVLRLPKGWFMYGPDVLKTQELPQPDRQTVPFLYRKDVIDWLDNGKLPETVKYRRVIMESKLSLDTFTMPVEDESMSSDQNNPLSLSTLDTVTIDPHHKPEPGFLVLISTKNGDIKIRQYAKDGDQVIFCAFDRRYPIIFADDGVRILGVIVEKTTNTIPRYNKT